MKKWYRTGMAGILLLMLLAVSGCAKEAAVEEPVSVEKPKETEMGAEDTAEAGTEAETEAETEAKAETETETDTAQKLLGTFPRDFVFSSGAGAWGTFLTLNSDGSFTGGYNDSDMGDTGEGYPHGKHYYCEFQGKFGNFEIIDENTISMTLEELVFEPEAGAEEIREEILYVGAAPLGLAGGTEFVLYLPGTPTAGLPEEFLSWQPYCYTVDGELKKSLSCYGIRNLDTEDGFFSDDVCQECGGGISPQTGLCNTCGKEAGA